MRQRSSLSPLFVCFGLLPIWKALSSPYAIPALSNSLIQVIVPLLALLAWDIGGRRGTSHGAAWATGITGSLATVVLSYARTGQVSSSPVFEVAAICASVVIYATYSLFFLLWARAYVCLDIGRAGIAVGGSYLLASLGYFALSLLDPTVGLGISICLPLMSAWALASCADQPPASIHCDEGRYRVADLVRSKLFPRHIIIAVAAFSLAAGVSRLQTSASGDLFAVGIAGACFVAFATVTRSRSKSLVYQACRATITVMTLSMLVGLVLGNQMFAQVFIGVAQTLSTIVLVLYICDSARRFNLPVFPIAAAARVCTSTAFLLGSELGRRAITSLGDLSAVAPVVYGVAAAVVVVASVWWLAGAPYRQADEGGDSVTGGDYLPSASASPSNVPRESAQEEIPQLLSSFVESRCSSLQSEYGLSSRETEVLSLLARGNSAKRIEEVLVLSPSTVKTHIRHIYAKLGIHSRAELESLLFGEPEDEIARH